MRKKFKTENSRKYDAREKIVSYSMQTLKEPQKAKKTNREKQNYGVRTWEWQGCASVLISLPWLPLTSTIGKNLLVAKWFALL